MRLHGFTGGGGARDVWDDREGVCLRIQHPRIKGQNRILAEEQKEVFEGFGHKEALLDIVLGGAFAVDIFNTRVPTRGNPALAL